MVRVDYEWTSKGDYNEIEDWATRFLCHLNSSLFGKSQKLRYVNIKLIPKEEGEVVGWCHGDEEEVWIELSETLIDDEDYFTETLAHELVHAEQILSGRLEDLEAFKTMWEGTEYINLRGHLKPEIYKALPWEAEAYKRQSDYTLIEKGVFFEV